MPKVYCDWHGFDWIWDSEGRCWIIDVEKSGGPPDPTIENPQQPPFLVLQNRNYFSARVSDINAAVKAIMSAYESGTIDVEERDNIIDAIKHDIVFDALRIGQFCGLSIGDKPFQVLFHIDWLQCIDA